MIFGIKTWDLDLKSVFWGSLCFCVRGHSVLLHLRHRFCGGVGFEAKGLGVLQLQWRAAWHVVLGHEATLRSERHGQTDCKTQPTSKSQRRRKKNRAAALSEFRQLLPSSTASHAVAATILVVLIEAYRVVAQFMGVRSSGFMGHVLANAHGQAAYKYRKKTK